jgi:Carboxypeptidase regulatory-like domain
MTRSLAFACFLLSALLTSAQAPAPTANTSSIAGTVLKDPGSLPLRKALLELIAEDPKQGANYTATTDGDGRFHIEKVQPGRYRLFLEKTGFVQVNASGRKMENDVLTVTPGVENYELVFHMLANAVITGRVTDEDGEPISHVAIYVIRKKPGKAKSTEGSGVERTNDQGEYRFFGLFPGQYFVMAVPPPDARDYMQPRDPKRRDDSKDQTRYLTTYYPGTHDGAQAQAVPLRAGDELPVNFVLIPARTYHLSGIVTGARPRQEITVQLLPKGINAGPATNAAEVSASGTFDLPGVAPGSYVARVLTDLESDSPTFSARLDVTVVAADIEGLSLALSPSFSVTGHLRFDGPRPATFTQFTAVLKPVKDIENDFNSLGSQISATVDRFGNFVWTNVAPGEYFASAPGIEEAGAFLKSVSLGDRSVDEGFALSGAATVELSISSRGATLEGAVLEKDQPVSNANVVAVPEARFRKLTSRFRVSTTDQIGRFTLRGLTPGSYTVFAWQDMDHDLYSDPDFLKSQESNGTPVKLEESSNQKVDLKLSPVAEEWR